MLTDHYKFVDFLKQALTYSVILLTHKVLVTKKWMLFGIHFDNLRDIANYFMLSIIFSLDKSN